MMPYSRIFLRNAYNGTAATATGQWGYDGFCDSTAATCPHHPIRVYYGYNEPSFDPEPPPTKRPKQFWKSKFERIGRR